MASGKITGNLNTQALFKLTSIPNESVVPRVSFTMCEKSFRGRPTKGGLSHFGPDVLSSPVLTRSSCAALPQMLSSEESIHFSPTR